MPCHYCGALPGNVKKTKNTINPFLYSGIDRVVNTVGYELGNVVPCCAVCNRAKGDMTVAEFAEWVSRIEAMAAQWGIADKPLCHLPTLAERTEAAENSAIDA